MSHDRLSGLVSERLTTLRSDFAAGQRDLARLDEQRETLRVALLRLSGAIQALTDLTYSLAVPDRGDGVPGQEEQAPTLVDVNAAGDRASSA